MEQLITSRKKYDSNRRSYSRRHSQPTRTRGSSNPNNPKKRTSKQRNYSAPAVRKTKKEEVKKTTQTKTRPKTRTGANNPIKIALFPSKSYDFSVLFLVLMLTFFGVVMIFSSSYYHALTKFGDMYYFLKRQSLWAVIGIGAMIFMMNFDYHRLKYFATIIFIFSIVCLVLVIFIGTEINGSKRWLGFGTFSFQPSELAKISVILFISTLISNNKDILNKFSGFIYLMIVVFIPVGLIAIQNMSTAIVAAFVGIIIIFIASPKIWYFFPAAIPIVPAAIVMVTNKEFFYRMQRITAWLDPFSDPTDTGFQTVQSLYAVASGGIFGLGLGQSRQKLGYIPEAYNDIIFSIICEELGLVGAITLLALFMLLVWRGIKIALNARDLFGCLLASGITGLIAIQVLINIAVITNTIPVTGMPLPFISYGGSSLVLVMGAVGILLNISKYTIK